MERSCCHRELDAGARSVHDDFLRSLRLGCWLGLVCLGDLHLYLISIFKLELTTRFAISQTYGGCIVALDDNYEVHALFLPLHVVLTVPPDQLHLHVVVVDPSRSCGLILCGIVAGRSLRSSDDAAETYVCFADLGSSDERCHGGS